MTEPEMPTAQEMLDHFQEDKDFHMEVRAWREEMQPMFDAFKKNKIKHMVWEEDTNTVYIYAKKISTIVLAITGVWAFLKYIVITYLLK